jgi:hypothetical protein
MHEHLKQYYVKEEEFLDHFESAAIVAARCIQGEWTPNYRCDDAVRKQREAQLSAGTLRELVFTGAALYQVDAHFSSIQIALRSAARMLNIRVRRTDTEELVAEKIVDRRP